MANFKVRNEYFRAAQRHLAVCKELRKRIESIDSENELKYQLLCDLYYLTGYVIECSCCTAIFHHFSNLEHKKLLDKSTNGKYSKVFFRISKEDKKNFGVADSDHKLVNFKKAARQDIFANLFVSATKVAIPLLDGKTDIFSNNHCLNLYTQYEAEVRYDKINLEGIILNTLNCFGFLKAAETIYEKSKSYCNIK